MEAEEGVAVLRQQKTEKSGCPYEDKVEIESTKGAPNTAKLGTGRRNGAEENLLEQFLSRDNLNQAFAKVKAKGGKHGVDGLSIKETLLNSLREGKYQQGYTRVVDIDLAQYLLER